MLAMQNTMHAGYMITGNKPMFLDTDGSVAWLYHYPKVLSLLRLLVKCYDRNPILYDPTTKFYTLSPVKLMTGHPIYPVWGIKLMCLNLISRMTISGINSSPIACILVNVCCSSQLNLDIFFSFPHSTVGVLECILPNKRKIFGILSSKLQLPALS